MNIASHLRRSAPHIFIGIFVIALLAGIGLAHVENLMLASHLADSFVNSLHGPGFAVVAILVFAILRIYHRSRANYLYAAAITMTIGVLSEVAQIPGPRDASYGDLLSDAIGIIAGLGTLAIFDAGIRTQLGRRALLGITVITGIALLIVALPAAAYGYAAVAQYRALPSLLSFENLWEQASYEQTWRRRPERIPAPAGWPEAGKFVAYTTESGRSGRYIRLEPYPDWTGYTSVSFVAASADDGEHTVILTIRDLADEGRKRGNIHREEIRVGPRPIRFIFPLQRIRDDESGRPFNFKRVSSITLNAAEPKSGRSLYMDDFRLD